MSSDIISLACLVVTLFLSYHFYSQAQLKKRLKLNWGEYRPVVEKFSMDLVRVYRNLKEVGLPEQEVSVLLNMLVDRNFIKIENYRITILSEKLPESLE